MTVSREMPKYQCHKQVWALKIKAIGEGSSNSEFAILQFEEAGYGPLPVSADWHFKHKPEPGGYYVVYEDGYKSYSPASAFESGYSLCNPHTGALRDPRDVASDPQAILCTKPGEPLKAAPGPVAFGDEEHVAVPRGLICAACSAIEHKREGKNTVAELRRYTFGDLSAAATVALPVIDPGPDSLERAHAETHASAVLYPAIKAAMEELQTLHPGFNDAVNRAFNLLHDAFWSECLVPAGASPRRSVGEAASDFLTGKTACSMAGEGACEACQ